MMRKMSVAGERERNRNEGKKNKEEGRKDGRTEGRKARRIDGLPAAV